MIEHKQDVWTFVEQYYPDYYSCIWIANEQDLYKLVTGEYEEGDSAHQLLEEDYKGDIENSEIETDWNRIQSMIYEKAIQGYINSIK
jgi:uncharacterized protein YuzB (UPF0349 family)